MRKLLTKYLTNTNTREYYLTSDILALFTVLSIVSIVLETVPSLSHFAFWFLLIEWVSVVVFTLEYIARIYLAKPVWRYVFSFYGLIDLLAILPTFLGLGNLTFLKSARAVRLIRLLRMVRLAKMKHLNVKDVEERMSFFAVNIALFLTITITAMLLVGTLIYLVEGTNAAFSSIPHGMLWAFKMFLLGLPIELPTTVGGQIVHIIGRLIGLTVFGVLIGVVGNVIHNYFFATKT